MKFSTESHDPKEVPELGPAGYSKYFLALIQTPSTVYWDIVQYDKGYAKFKPWRTFENHGVTILCYFELPEPENVPNLLRTT